MASETPKIHVFIVSYPAQGQVNPLLRLAKCLASIGGFLVTFSTTSHFSHKIIDSNNITPRHPYPVGHDGFLRFDSFHDGLPELDPRRRVPAFYSPHLDLVGRKLLPKMLRRLAHDSIPVSCLINGTLVPWVSDVAADLQIPNATYWAQSCASFLTFYYFYNNLAPFPTEFDPFIDFDIPTLPLLKWYDLHTFVHPFFPTPHVKNVWVGEFANLAKPFCILLDTFDELEHDTLKLANDLCPVGVKPIGPLFKSPHIKAPAIAALRGDQNRADFDCLQWLDTKPRRSVVYICFGSLAHLKQEQIVEIAHGVLAAGAPFLWVMKPPTKDIELDPHELPGEFLERLGDDGKVVEYSPQEEVLGHGSVGCFLTHCGWNSTMEAVTLGVPVVTFPQWGDQMTDAKFLVDVFGVGVGMGRANEERVVPRGEVEGCVREAMVGRKAEEVRRNAGEWKEKAEGACREGGSSERNLREFVEEIRRRSVDAVGNYTESADDQAEEEAEEASPVSNVYPRHFFF